MIWFIGITAFPQPIFLQLRVTYDFSSDIQTTRAACNKESNACGMARPGRWEMSSAGDIFVRSAKLSRKVHGEPSHIGKSVLAQLGCIPGVNRPLGSDETSGGILSLLDEGFET